MEKTVSCIRSQDFEHGMTTMYEASREGQAEQPSSDETYCRTKCELLVSLLLPFQQLPKPLETVKGNSGDEGHDDEFLPPLHGDLYSSHRNGFAMHHTCPCQYSRLIEYLTVSCRYVL
jgi:hypothetical protein